MTITRIGEVEGFPFEPNDRMWHDKYQITLTRHHKQYRFFFYGSFYDWKNNKRPSRYDVLACIEKYDPCDFEDFCSEYGYAYEDEKQYKRVRKIYNACKEQYERLLDLFGEELMEELREIN